MISNKAGFTYTLHLPSGMGSKCTNPMTSANKPYHSSTWASQYTCGEQGVDENRTHAYWGMYYYTKGRAEKNLMTVPFINNVGLDLGVSAKPPSTKFETIVSALETPFRPFTAGMWAAIIFTFVVGAVFMWIIEVRRLSFVITIVVTFVVTFVVTLNLTTNIHDTYTASVHRRREVLSQKLKGPYSHEDEQPAQTRVGLSLTP